MSEKSTASGNGIGFFTVLFLIFLTLKLTGHIDWSWWLVTAPLWGCVAVFAVIVFIVGILFVLATLMEKKKG
jgi:hypothetical protein